MTPDNTAVLPGVISFNAVLSKLYSSTRQGELHRLFLYLSNYNTSSLLLLAITSRIDYLFVSPELAKRLTPSIVITGLPAMHSDEASDHLSVYVAFTAFSGGFLAFEPFSGIDARILQSYHI
jgi:hypothetical protein